MQILIKLTISKFEVSIATFEHCIITQKGTNMNWALGFLKWVQTN